MSVKCVTEKETFLYFLPERKYIFEWIYLCKTLCQSDMYFIRNFLYTIQRKDTINKVYKRRESNY